MNIRNIGASLGIALFGGSLRSTLAGLTAGLMVWGAIGLALNTKN